LIDENQLGKDLEYLSGLYQPRTKLNADESLEAITVLVERHGSMCWNCHKPSWQLMIEDDAVRKAKGLPKRKRRILVVHEIIEGMFHSSIMDNKKDPPIHLKWGGCRPVCYSCNQELGHNIATITDKKTMTWQALKSVKVRGAFRKIVDTYISKKTHVCLKMCVNTLSAPEKLHCSQEVLEEVVKQNVGTKWDIINIDDFNIECDYCKNYYGDNNHIIWKGKPPIQNITDMEAVMQEEGEGQ